MKICRGISLRSVHGVALTMVPTVNAIVYVPKSDEGSGACSCEIEASRARLRRRVCMVVKRKGAVRTWNCRPWHVHEISPPCLLPRCPSLRWLNRPGLSFIMRHCNLCQRIFCTERAYSSHNYSIHKFPKPPPPPSHSVHHPHLTGASTWRSS